MPGVGLGARLLPVQSTIAVPFDVHDSRGMESDLLIRSARRADLPELIALYADDDLGKSRDGGEPNSRYVSAFEAIDADPNQFLAVGVVGEVIAATLLLSFIPGLSRHGAWRAQIEAMRVRSNMRGHGLGQEMLGWAVARAKERGCDLVQLTSDRRRPDAHRFYERVGFEPTHIGFKLFIGEK